MPRLGWDIALDEAWRVGRHYYDRVERGYHLYQVPRYDTGDRRGCGRMFTGSVWATLYLDTVDLAVLLDVAVERTLTSQKAKHDVLKINVELICRKGTFRVPFGSKESL